METSVIIGWLLIHVFALPTMDGDNIVNLSPIDLASGQAETNGANRIYKTLEECNTAMKALVFNPDERPKYQVELYPDDHLVATRVKKSKDGGMLSKIWCSPLRDIKD